MVQVGLNNQNYGEPIRYDLGHEKRYTGTISEVSDIKEMEFKYDDEPKERLVISFQSKLDDLDIDDETREQLKDYIQSEVEEREENDLQVDHPEDAVEMVMIPTAKVTPSAGDNISESKLYGTLRKLGLADADDDGNVTLYNREGEEVTPLQDADNPNEAFASYLKQNLTGMEVTYEISNAKRGTDEEYSSVGKVVDLENDPQVEE